VSHASPALDAERLTRLLEVGRGLVAELQVDAVLDRLLETAAELTGAQYAAMGVLDADRVELARFITRGIDEQTHRAIGDLPRGRGILGVLIREPKALRLDDVNADPRSYGFPINHPPMSTFLGVPVIIRGEAWGNLYLTEKAGGGPFDEADEAAVTVLADWAAIAIDNARLYSSLETRSAELTRAVRGFEATSAIATAVVTETSVDRVLELVVKRARALVEARSVVVLLREADDLVLAASAGQVATGDGRRIPVLGSTTGEVLETGRPRRIDDVERQLRIPADRLGVHDAAVALLVPLVYRGRALGVLAAFDRLTGDETFTADDEQVMRSFAASAATAVATARTVEADRLRHSLQAAEAERGRWARELHDETLQALGGLNVLLRSAARSSDPEVLREAIADATEHVAREIENLRAIITELRPAALDELGLAPALATLVSRVASTSGLEVETAIDINGRLQPEQETTAYRVVQEALSNVVKHADATKAEVRVAMDDGELRITVTDDGHGFDPDATTGGFGLVGMRERIDLAGGSLTLGPNDPGTRVEASLPALARP
jgi:two-component system, NarL family, sensor histidine kinase DevS